MKKQKVSSYGEFKQFVDQHSPEQAMEIQKQWRKKTKQAKNRLFTRILILATIIVAIIFVITLNFFIDNKKSHTILDQDQDGYTLVQTVFPHLKVLVSNQILTYQTKMVRSVGIVYEELVSWIQANIPSNSRVLYIPNQNSGTTVLGMALSYYLSSLNGGQLDIVLNSDNYKQHLIKNSQQMKNFKDQKIIFNFVNSQTQITKDYDLLLVENNEYLKDITLTRFKKVVEVRKKKWDDTAINSYMKSYTKYEINKGKFNSQTLAFGQFKSFSMVELKQSSREVYKIILVLVKPQPNINLCPQNIQFFINSSQKRNLLQYLRNKTLAPKGYVFYGINDMYTFKSIAQIQNIAHFILGGPQAIQSIKSEKSSLSSSLKHTYILSWTDFNSFKTKLKGEIIIYVSNSQQASQITNLSKSYSINMITPFNNNGCLFAARVLPYQTITPFHPFFLVLTIN